MAKQQTVSKPAVVPTVADAEQAIAVLERDRAALATARAQDDAEMSKHAYQARVHHEPGAVRALSEIGERTLEHDQRLHEIEAAMVTAKSVLEEARQAEHAKAERARAGAQRAAFERLKLAGQMLDDALAVLVAVGDEIHTAVDTLHVAGWDHPTGQQVLSFGERAIRTAIMQTMWSRCVERLAPNEKVSFSHVVSQWQQVFERRLGEPQKEEAA